MISKKSKSFIDNFEASVRLHDRRGGGDPIDYDACVRSYEKHKEILIAHIEQLEKPNDQAHK